MTQQSPRKLKLSARSGSTERSTTGNISSPAVKPTSAMSVASHGSIGRSSRLSELDNTADVVNAADEIVGNDSSLTADINRCVSSCPTLF